MAQIHRIDARARNRVADQATAAAARGPRIAEAARTNPGGAVRDVVFLIVDPSRWCQSAVN